MKNILFLFTFLLIACQLSGQEDYALFGKGGGFTGETTTYKLYRNGKVLKGIGTAEILYKEEGKIRKKEAREIFKKLENSLNEPFSQPGNMSYFIEKSVNDSVQRYTWGANEFIVPDGIKEIYKETFQKLSSLEFQPI